MENKMEVPTPNLIKLQHINYESERLHNRIMEITGERTTLETKMMFGQIDETLFYMKLKCLDYEMNYVIQPKIDNLQSELELVGILMDSKIQLSEN
jgi:hypothetical protein